jgi:hypothetical protein
MIILHKKICVKASFQDSLMTAGNIDHFARKGEREGQLSRQPDDSWQK